MGWFQELFGPASPPTFEQDLELLIARWTERTKGPQALNLKQVAVLLALKAKQLSQELP